MISIESRSGIGQDFELEFGGNWITPDTSLLVRESAKYRCAAFFPGAKQAQTYLRWGTSTGERRLTIEIVGVQHIAYDAAPEPLRKALYPWVERLAVRLRRVRRHD